MRGFILLLSAVAVAFCLIAPEASATTMTFTSSAAFNLALSGSPVKIEGWDTYALNSTIANGATLNGVTYSAFPGGTLGRIDNQFNHFGTQSLALRRASDPNPNKSFFNPGEALGISFASPIYALGIFFNSNSTSSGSLGILSTPIGTVTTGGPTYDVGTFYFAGLISTTPFSTATIGSNTRRSSSFNLDNLTFTSIVPDRLGFLTPALVLGSLCALGFRIRRRPGLE